MKRIKRIIAAVAASAMVLGMSFSTFAAPNELSISATVTEGGTEAVVTVTAGSGINANGIDAYVTYDASKVEPVIVMDGEDVDAFAYFTEAFQSATPGYMYTIGNETGQQRMHIITASARNREIPDGTDVAVFKFTLKEAVTEEAGEEVDLGFTLGVNTLMDMNEADLPQGGTVSAPVPAVVQPAQDPGESQEPTESQNPGESQTPASGTPTSAAPSVAPSSAATNRSPKTADTASVVVPVIALCGAAAAIVVASKKKVNE